MGFLYKNKKRGILVQIEVDSFEDLRDDERVLDALKKLYLRVIYYNAMSGDVPDPPKPRRWWAKFTRYLRGKTT
jgi:hypothetical protein